MTQTHTHTHTHKITFSFSLSLNSYLRGLFGGSSPVHMATVKILMQQFVANHL